MPGRRMHALRRINHSLSLSSGAGGGVDVDQGERSVASLGSGSYPSFVRRVMHPLPHRYVVSAQGEVAGTLQVAASGLPDLACAAPAEFGGPGDRWSPEHLLCGAIASCFILTFRAVARAAKLEWESLECTVEGVLERVDGVTQFTRIVTNAVLTVEQDADLDPYRRALEKAEHGCLVANSLRASRELRAELRVAEVV